MPPYPPNSLGFVQRSGSDPHPLQGRAARRLLVQAARGVPLLQREAGACDGGAPGGAGAAARALPAMDAVLSAPGAMGTAEGEGAALGRPHPFPASGVCPATSQGTAAGRARWTDRGRLFSPIFRLGLASNPSLPCAGAGWRLGTTGRRGTLRRAAATQPGGGGAAAGGAAPPGATHAADARCAARGRARGRAAGLSGPVPSAALPMDGAGRAATAQEGAPLRLPGGLLPPCQHPPACK
jgi:hypothetical protein